MRKHFAFRALGVIVLMALVLNAPHAFGQIDDDAVPVIEEAQSLFEDGLTAFERERYEVSSEYFMRAYQDFPLHRRSTASLLMAGKAFYRDEQYDRAIEMLERLQNGYPTSGYLEEASRIENFARRKADRAEEPRVFQLGVVLPIEDDDVVLSQALFNGVHVAVQRANDAGETPVRLRFRNTENDPDVARRVVEELAAEGVDAIIGPLYSREAQAAASAAQSAGVVMLAPLATDKAVSEGRSYVFQANPTIEMRGRVMARYARDELGLSSFGVISQGDNNISQLMAEAFQQEIVEEGGDLRFFHQLENSRGWPRIVEEVGEDYFRDLEGLYLPIAGGNAPQSIRNALNSLDGTDTPLQILGNSEWHNRNVEQQASRYVATYTNDFHVDSDRTEVQEFIELYSGRYQEIPEQLTFTGRRLAYAGYDIANFLLERRHVNEGGELREALYSDEAYDGLGMRIRFGGGNINDAMFYHRYRTGRIELMR